MEFIIIGLFIIFFSYILLYSLYVRFFKSSGNIVEGLSALKQAQTAQAKSADGDAKTQAQSEKHPNATLNNSMKLVNKPSNP